MGIVGLVDSYLSELGAYELSRMLGLNTIPATTQSKIKKVGSVRLWMDVAASEAELLRNKF